MRDAFPRNSHRLFTRSRIALLWLAALLTATPAASQSMAFQFSFSNPGARSTGFGGAFVALADDATAAFANPAGLVQLTEPEVSIEVRSWDYSTPYFHGGGFGGPPSGFGLDTVAGVRRANSEADLDGLSFLSYVHTHKKWSLAFYRHQQADFEFSGETQGVFISNLDPGAERARIADIRGANDLEVTSHALVGAYRVTDALSLGFGLAHHNGKMRQAQARYAWDEDTEASRFGSNSFLPQRMIDSTATSLDDEDWALTAGLLWRFRPGWSLGSFYREGPEFDAQSEIVVGPLHPSGTAGVSVNGSFPLGFPDVAGAGIVYRSRGGRLTLSFEWDHVDYSTLFTSYRNGLEGLDEAVTVAGFSDDAEELHLGAEYVFVGPAAPIAVRWGIWREPDHQIRPGTLAGQTIVIGDDDTHMAIGFGAVFSTFQIDVAADFSDLRDTLSASAIYRF